METAILIASVAVATMSAIFAWRAVGEAAKQNELSRKAIQAQTFLMVVSTARELHFSKGMDLIRKLNYRSYSAFTAKESKNTQEQIRTVVDFLNDLMHLIENDYLPEEHVLKIYYSSIRDCSEHLLPWWVEGFRKEQEGEYYYLKFKQLCAKVPPKEEKRIKRIKKIKQQAAK